jgi:hypothetical protein
VFTLGISFVGRGQEIRVSGLLENHEGDKLFGLNPFMEQAVSSINKVPEQLCDAKKNNLEEGSRLRHTRRKIQNS